MPPSWPVRWPSAAACTGGFAAAGAGANAVNKIANGVRAFIDGDGATGIIADSVTLTAIDTSTIDAITGSASVAATFAPVGATAAIAVALADNKISNEVEASISNADHLLARVGDITVTASETASIDALTAAAAAAVTVAIGASFSGAGADATNTITNTVQAFIADSGHVAAEGAVTVSAESMATVSAEIVAISVSVALARHLRRCVGGHEYDQRNDLGLYRQRHGHRAGRGYHRHGR